MNQRLFFTSLVLVTAGTAALLFALHLHPNLYTHQLFSWASLALFVLMSLGMYYAGYKAAMSENKNDFTSAILGFTMGKLLLSGIAILIYHRLMKPEGIAFILPFMSIYLIYTIFETYFMTQLGRLKP